MSVTEDSALGEAAGLRVKKDVNLLPGVNGLFTSAIAKDFVEEFDSVRKGGGLAPGFKPMSSSAMALSTEKPLDRLVV
jgi:hypothetical protein